MRRIWILLLASAMALTMAIPASAKKPPKPPKPSGTAPIAVTIDAEPIWAHEGDDLLRYTVFLENKTSEPIGDIQVEFTAAGMNDLVNSLVVPASQTVALDVFSRYARDFPVTTMCLIDEECQLEASVSVAIADENVATASMTTPLMPVPACGFVYDERFSSDPVPMNGLCIWNLPDDNGLTKTGVWEISLDPTPPRNPQKPIGVSTTVRDGVPGNWCSLAVGIPSGVGGRWRTGDAPITGEMYLPGNENAITLGLPEGMCLSGGAGGDYFAVGNPKGFYLNTTDATVTVRWMRSLP